MAMPIDVPEIDRRFGFHAADTEEKQNTHKLIRMGCRNLAVDLIALTGEPSREQSLMVTALEEAMMWGNADVARKGAA